ncbi:MAG: alcohol dehydrogenase catalytic domain-containing protein [Burkholderiales bacterium]|nr:alcohol dehydrogenase catalytic domain-containing protein [Burkholderiales bacterium]
MTIRCKAAVLRTIGAPRPYARSKPLSIEEVDLAAPKPVELLVRIAGAGLCHSDLSVINGDRPRPVPLALGHEGSGEVVEVGAAIDDVRPGDHVVFQFSAACGRCRRCVEGRPQVCERARVAKSAGGLMAGGSRISALNGEHIDHHSGLSCMAQYAVVDRGSVVVIDQSMPLADAAVFGCAVMTGVGAVVNTARIRPGDTVAIIGLGGVGLSGVLGARLAGAETIIAIDLEHSKLEVALSVGATHALCARDADCIEQVRDLTRGGVDYAFELGGSVDAMKMGYAIIQYGGTLVAAGLPALSATFNVNQCDLVGQEKSIRGSYMGSCVPIRDIPRFIRLYQEGRLPVDRLIDGHIGYDDLNAGFDKLQDARAIRQILTPNASPAAA